ncbi:MAG: hypothetical protein NTW05_10835 [Pseudonocardiales bacterium]|nr:hypothetical protein [Pseudonocardiales bacterium]
MPKEGVIPALPVLPDVTPADVGVIGLYAVLLFLPGGLVALLCGLRGWTLAAAAPLLTYGLVGIGGPLYAAVGLPWSAGTAAAGTAVVLLLVPGARLLLHRRHAVPGDAPDPVPSRPAWSRPADIGVAVAVAVAALTGVAAVLGGIRDLGAVPQDWDAVFHANGIRLIADTGDGSLVGMGRVNWYESDVTVYYPNAYHLLATAVYQVSGATIPTVLNAHTVLVPGLLAVSLAALVRRAGGRPVLAGAAALAAVATTALYDMLWRGPLLPFATGVVLTPVIVVLLLDLLDAPGARAAVRPGAAFALGVAGLLCLHPAILIGAVLFTAPAVVQRWWGAPRAVPREVLRLAVPGLAAAAACTLQLAGAAGSSGNLANIDWPAVYSMPEAVGRLLVFGSDAPTVQLVLAAVLVVGLVTYRSLGALRWAGVSAALFGVLYVAAASSDEPWVGTVTSLWWNDRFRLVALAAVPMALVVGHGAAELQRGVAAVLARGPVRVHRTVLGAATAAAVLAGFVVVTNGLYLDRNQERMTNNVGDGPAVSALEIEGMQAVAGIVPPGERVLNDRGDGSAWMYALAGVLPVAAHYDATATGPYSSLLASRFNAYADDPAVRAAVDRLDIRYVQVDRGFLRGAEGAGREAGLTDLAGRPWLQVVYRNPDVVLYEILPERVAPATDADGAP